MSTSTPNDDEANSEAVVLSQESSTSSKSTYTNRFWDSQPSAPTGFISRFFLDIPPTQQFRTANDLCSHLYGTDTPKLDALQSLKNNTPCIVHMPGTSRTVRVLHALGSELFSSSSDASYIGPPYDRVLALSGEHYPSFIPPHAMTIDNSAFQKRSYPAPTEEEFEAVLQTLEPTDNKAHLFIGSKLTSSVVVGQIIPIPAVFVYDAFDKDIDTLVLYERVRTAAQDPTHTCSFLLQELLRFLRAGPVRRTKENHITLPLDTLVARLDASMVTWRYNRLFDIYNAPDTQDQRTRKDTTTSTNATATISTIVLDDDDASKPNQTTVTEQSSRQPQAPASKPSAKPSASSSAFPSTAPAPSVSFAASATTAPAPVHGSTAAPETATPTVVTPEKTMVITEAVFLKMLETIRKGPDDPPNSRSRVSSDSGNDEDDDATETLGLPHSAFETLLVQCGLPESMKDDIPEVWHKLAEKKLQKSDKQRIIKQCFKRALKYRCSKVPMLASVITMVRERSFEGEEGVSSLSAAVKGLSPFAVPKLTERQIDEHNATAEHLATATSTTVKDVASNKITCSAPQTYDDLVKQLKRFCNLCYALFGDVSPMVLILVHIIDILEEFNDVEQSSMTWESIASILWIVMLQARSFAAGDLKDPDSTIPVFQYMGVALQSRRDISHGGVPSSLYILHKPSPHKRPASPPSDPQGKDKKQKTTGNDYTPISRANIYNKDMKSAMAGLAAMTPRPTIRNICKAASISATQLFPSRGDKLCLKAQLWGQCSKGCAFQHPELPKNEIDHALSLLKLVTDNPKLVTKVN